MAADTKASDADHLQDEAALQALQTEQLKALVQHAQAMLQAMSAWRMHIGEQAARVIDTCRTTSATLARVAPAEALDKLKDAISREGQTRKELTAAADDEKTEVSCVNECRRKWNRKCARLTDYFECRLWNARCCLLRVLRLRRPALPRFASRDP